MEFVANIPHYRVVSERESLAKHILHHHYLARIRQERAWAPLDLPTIHQDNFRPWHHTSPQSLEQSRRLCQYWKLVASLPERSHDSSVFSDWLKAKLRRGKIQEDLRRRRLRDSDEVSHDRYLRDRCNILPTLSLVKF